MHENRTARRGTKSFKRDSAVTRQRAGDRRFTQPGHVHRAHAGGLARLELVHRSGTLIDRPQVAIAVKLQAGPGVSAEALADTELPDQGVAVGRVEHVDRVVW